MGKNCISVINRFNIYGYGCLNCRNDYESALMYAAELIRSQYKKNGALGECFAMVYDKLNRTRVVVWLTDDMKVKYRKLF